MAWFSGSNLAAQIWRAFVTDGVPASGAHKPVKSQIRTWGATVEARLELTLDANRDWFVSTTGNDTTGDGTSGAPYLTLQRAWTDIAKLDLNNFRARIRFSGAGARTFSTTGLVLLQCSTWPRGNGTVRIEGDTATPSNIKLQSATGGASGSGAAIQVRGPQGGVTLEIAGVELTSSSLSSGQPSGAGLDHNGQGKVVADFCRFNGNAFGIKVNGNNAHVEGPSSTTWTFFGTIGVGILCDSGYVINIGTNVYESDPTFTSSIVEVNFGGRMFLTAGSGTINAATLTRARVKDRSLLRTHTHQFDAVLPGTGAVDVQPGSVAEDGGFATKFSAAALAYGLVTFSGGVPTLVAGQSFGVSNIIDTALGQTSVTLNRRMNTATYPVIATVQDAAGCSTTITYTSDQVFRVNTFSAANAAADQNFSFVVFGTQRDDF